MGADLFATCSCRTVAASAPMRVRHTHPFPFAFRVVQSGKTSTWREPQAEQTSRPELASEGNGVVSGRPRVWNATLPC